MRWLLVVACLVGCRNGGKENAAPSQAGSPLLASVGDARVSASFATSEPQIQKLVTAANGVLSQLSRGKDCKLDLGRVTHVRLAIGEPLVVAGELDGDVDRARIACVFGPLLEEFGVTVVDRPGGVSITRGTARTTHVGAAALEAACANKSNCVAARLGPIATPLWIRYELAADTGSFVVSGPARSKELSDRFAAAIADAPVPGLKVQSTADALTLTLERVTEFEQAAGIQRLVEEFRIPSSSMMPTLVRGDFLIAVKGPLFRHEPGDVVMCRHEGSNWLGRVIATGGQTLTQAADTFAINGKPIESVVVEANAKWTESYEDSATENAGKRLRETLGRHRYEIYRTDRRRDAEPGTWSVPDAHLMLLGDNRDNANDSRYRGPVSESDAFGRAIGVWWAMKDDAPDWNRMGAPLE